MVDISKAERTQKWEKDVLRKDEEEEASKINYIQKLSSQVGSSQSVHYFKHYNIHPFVNPKV